MDDQVSESSVDSKAATQPKIPKYDWYQTDSHVVVNILVRQLKPEQVHVTISEKKVDADLKPDASDHFHLSLPLAHCITEATSSWKVTPSKLEVKLHKSDARRWEMLEDTTPTQPSEQAVKGYPTSRKHKVDWNKVENEVTKEEKDEKLEGDAGVNQLFQQIYANADEDTRRAMNKSFVESQGTVLSTNWTEVGKDKVDMKPPDGLEYKKY